MSRTTSASGGATSGGNIRSRILLSQWHSFSLKHQTDYQLYGTYLSEDSVTVTIKVPVLSLIHTERERCRLENGCGTNMQVASLVETLAHSLGVNSAIEINVFLSKHCR